MPSPIPSLGCRKRRVLVTGAAGGLGRLVCADLAAHDIAVTAVDRQARPGIVEADLLDVRALRAVAAGCSAAIHLAAFPAPGLAPDCELFANNTLATFHLLTVAVEQGMDVAVIASSVSAYGMTFAAHPFSPAYVPIDEDHPMAPQDPYALSKVIDEQTARMMARRHGISVVALRFHWVVDAARARARVRALAARPDPAADKELWSYIDSRDAAAACRQALGVRDGFHAVNICADDTLSDTFTSQLMSSRHPDTEIRAGLDPHRSPWSNEWARVVMGFTPRWSWRSDMPQTR